MVSVPVVLILFTKPLEIPIYDGKNIELEEKKTSIVWNI